MTNKRYTPMIKAPIPRKNQAIFQRFFKKIELRCKELEEKGMHPVLGKFILKDGLLKIYRDLINKRDKLEKILDLDSNKDPSFMDLMVTRIAASPELPRTFQIVQDLDGECVLVLETKSKTYENTKNKDTPVFSGGTKKGKPCWRIDTPEPEEWVSAVATGIVNVERTIQDALCSQKLCKDTVNEMPDLPFPIQYSLIGTPYLHKKTSEPKVAIYSPRAISSLDIAIDREWKMITEADTRRMTRGLLYAIKIMHAKKLAHQDLHTGNILVFRDLNGMYIKIIDFGIMLPFGQFVAQASKDYEPPEFHSAYREGHANAQFYSSHPNSYGAYLHAKLVRQNPRFTAQSLQSHEYRKANPKNDIFQIGLVLHALYTGIRVSKIVHQEVEAYDNPLIRGLLMANRERRFTIEQAQNLFSSYQGSLKRRLAVTRVQPVVARFLATIRVRLGFLQANELYPELRPYITKYHLQTIYEYILSLADTIEENLAYTDPSVRDLMALRIAKSANLPRTVQIVQDLKGECVLILETKSKDWQGKKIPSNISNSWKKNKPSWRIDTITPEPWWTTVVTGSAYIDKILGCAKSSQLLCKDAKKEEDDDLPYPINCSLVGDVYLTKKSPIRRKISIVSPRASFDLDKSFNNGQWQNFTAYERNRIAKGLFYGIQIIHGLGYAYHDLKPTSVLLFKDKRGFYAQISDFTNMIRWGEYDSSPVIGYEDPEILYAYNRNHSYTNYYKVNNKNDLTYGKFVYAQMLALSPQPRVITDDEMKVLRKVNPKTDMWGLGVLLYQFFIGASTLTKAHFMQLTENKNELIRGLLQSERSKRLDITHAIALQKHLTEPSLTVLNTGATPQITPIEDLSNKVDKIDIKDIALLPRANTLTPGFNANIDQSDSKQDMGAQARNTNGELNNTFQFRA